MWGKKWKKYIYIYPVRKLEGVLWNCGVGSFVGSRRVCFEIVWVERGSKENEKAQQPRKTVQKQYFSYLDIQHNRHAVLFQLRFLSPNLHNNSQLIEALYFPNLFYLVLNIWSISSISSKTNISNIFKLKLEIATMRLDLDFFFFFSKNKLCLRLKCCKFSRKV